MITLPKHSKAIPGFSWYYATKSGKVWSTKTNAFLRPHTGRGGYQTLTLFDDDGVKVYCSVHKVIMAAWNPSDDISVEITHKNHCNNDNRLSNLIWVHRESNETRWVNVNRGSKNGYAKLTEGQVKTIRRHKYYRGMYSDLAGEYDVHLTTIMRAYTGERWKHI